MVKIRIEAAEGSWAWGVSRRNPDLVMEARSILPLPGGITLAEYWMQGNPRDWTHEISVFPDVEEVLPLDESPSPSLYRIRYRESTLSGIMVKDEVLLRYPVSIQNGVVTVETIDRLSRIRQIASDIQRAGLAVKLASLRKVSPRVRLPGLTAGQRTLLHQAVAAGYFDVPRRLSLTRLAQMLSKSKSTVSETLAIVERKLVTYTLEAEP
jgi:HTH DNA binding domain